MFTPCLSCHCFLAAGKLFARFTAQQADSWFGEGGMENRNAGGLGEGRDVTRQFEGQEEDRSREVTGALPAVTELSGPVGTENCFC